MPRRPRKPSLRVDTTIPAGVHRRAEQIAAAKLAFLRNLKVHKNVGLAAWKCGYSRGTMMKMRGADPAFAAAWDEVWETVVDDLEAAMFQRAISGYRRPIYQQGQLVGHERVHHPLTGIFMLKAHRRDTYGDDAGRVTVSPQEYAQAVAEHFAGEEAAARAALAGTSSAGSAGSTGSAEPGSAEPSPAPRSLPAGPASREVAVQDGSASSASGASDAVSDVDGFEPPPLDGLVDGRVPVAKRRGRRAVDDAVDAVDAGATRSVPAAPEVPARAAKKTPRPTGVTRKARGGTR